jgi:hypothetical protein
MGRNAVKTGISDPEKGILINVKYLGFLVKPLILPRKVSPETLQTLGVMAIGLGFVLIGLGGFSTYHASQKLQHSAEMRQVEQKGEMNTQIMTLLIRNQELKSEQERKVAEAQAAHTPPPPPAEYYRPPAPPPPPTTYFTHTPPVGESPPPPATSPFQPPELIPGARDTAVEPPRASDWEEPESLLPEVPGRYLSIRQQHVIADTLRAHGRHVVTVESSYGDPVSREFAEELSKAFAEANWIVGSITEHRGLPLASGVTVSAASFPPAPETRAMYEALLSAGIAVTQQLDPKQQKGETIVLVGTPL